MKQFGVLPVCFNRTLLLIVAALCLFLSSYAEPPEMHIPALCFHSFYEEPYRGTPGKLSESYESFEDILHFLQVNGFRSYLPDRNKRVTEPDPQSVILTFDDGHVSQLKAAELLEKYDMRGIFFVIPSLIDVPQYPHMSSAQLASLVERGHIIGVHGHRHISMPVSGPEIIAVLDTVPELLMTKMEGITDDMIHSLAFPYGHFTPSVRRAMRSRYPFQYTVNPGYWNGRSTLIPRILITRNTDRQFYFDYLVGAFAGPRLLVMREENGSRQTVIHFENPERLDPASLYIRAASPDWEGRHYSVHAAGPYLSEETDLLIFDIVAYLETHHSKEHRALSFSVTEKEKDVYRFISEGYLIWVEKTCND